MIYDDVVPVLENRALAGGHFLLSLHAPRQAEATRSGQFAMIRLLGRSDVVLRRPMSIYDVKPLGSADEVAAGTLQKLPGNVPVSVETDTAGSSQGLRGAT